MNHLNTPNQSSHAAMALAFPPPKGDEDGAEGVAAAA